MHTTRTAFLTEDWDLMLETDGTLKMCAGEIESVLEQTINLSWRINIMVQGCLQLSDKRYSE